MTPQSPQVPLDLIGSIVKDLANIRPRTSPSIEIKEQVVRFVMAMKDNAKIPIRQTLKLIKLQPTRFYRWKKATELDNQKHQERQGSEGYTPNANLTAAIKKYPKADACRLRHLLAKEFEIRINPYQLKTARNKIFGGSPPYYRPAIHRRTTKNANKDRQQTAWLRYFCFLRVNDIDTDFPIALFFDRDTRTIVHWETGMSWPKTVSNGHTFESLRHCSDNDLMPSIIESSEKWWLANEFILCVESQGYQHRQNWSYDHALHKRTGKLAGWSILTSARNTLRDHLPGFREKFDQVVNSYNQFWPIADQKHQSPKQLASKSL
jgi:hypothetical protein